jgi:hypothetical protein
LTTLGCHDWDMSKQAETAEHQEMVTRQAIQKMIAVGTERRGK